MEIGIGVLFDGRPGCGLEFIQEASAAAEALGFAAIHVPDHVVTFEHYESTYPFSADGRPPMHPDQAFFEPMVLLQAVASATASIRLGTCIDLVGQRHPLVRAKEVATLDVLSGGRVEYGVGIGWSREEFDALGINWARRGARAAEHVEAMRAAWGPSPASFDGSFITFDGVYSFPKPVQQPLPVYFGGTSATALHRAFAVGDGWYGWYRPGDAVDQVAVAVDEAFEASGRSGDPQLIVGVQTDNSPAALAAGFDAARRLRAFRATAMVALSPGSWRDRLTTIARAAGL